jgi:hypothetical protein
MFVLELDVVLFVVRSRKLELLKSMRLLMQDDWVTDEARLLDLILKKLERLEGVLDRFLPLLERYERASNAGSMFQARREWRKNG